MSRFGSNPLDFFNSVYQDIPPWDIGAPQPAMAALLNEYPPTSPILDLGCGTGDLAIYLAKLGYQVTGIDFVEKAIANCRERAGSLPVEVTRLLDFQVADALKPSLLQRQFGAVVDLGFFTCSIPSNATSSWMKWVGSCFPAVTTTCTSLTSNFQYPACRVELVQRRCRVVLHRREAGGSRKSGRWSF